MAGQNWRKNKKGVLVNSEGKTALEVRLDKYATKLKARKEKLAAKKAAKASSGGGGGGGGGGGAIVPTTRGAIVPTTAPTATMTKENKKETKPSVNYPNYLKADKPTFSVSTDRFIEIVQNRNNRKYELEQARTGKQVQKLIDDGIDVPDEILNKYEKVRDKKGNAEKIAANRKAFNEAEDILAKADGPVMSDKEAKGYKPMMSEKEAADYARDSVFGDTSMFHGASGASIDRKLTNGVNVAKASRGFEGEGFYMTPVAKEAETYAISAPRNGEPAYLEAKVKAKKPFVTTQQEIWALQRKLDENLSDTVGDGRWTTKMLKANGYDSIYVKDLGFFVAFDGRQVASYKKHKSKLTKDEFESLTGAEASKRLDNWRKQDGRFEELKRMGG